MKKEKVKNLLILVLSLTTFALSSVLAFNWSRLNSSDVRAKAARPSQASKDAKLAVSKRVDVRGALRAKTPELQKCYESYLDYSPSVVNGSVRVTWIIDQSGKVTVPSVLENDFKNDFLSKCILKEVEGWTFPAAAEPVQVAHRFTFRQRVPASLDF